LISAVLFRLAVRAPGQDRDGTPIARVNPPVPHAGDLRVSPASLDLGRIPLQPELRRTLEIENTSARPIIIKRFRLSCTCTSANPASLTIGPSERRSVEFTLDLMKADSPGHGIPLGDTDYSVWVSPIVEGEGPLTTWTLHGRVVKSLDISDAELHFGDVLRVDTTSSRSVRIAAPGRIARLTATCASPEVVAVLDGRPPSELQYLGVSIKTSTALGPRDAMIRLDGQTVDGTPLRGYIKARWDVVGDVAIAPSVFVDVARRRGEVFRSRVVLSCRTGAKVRGDSFQADSPSVKIRPVDQPGGPDPEFEVETTIDQIGEIRHSVRFSVAFGEPGASRDEITLPIIGFGLSDGEANQGR
jgi:hypothetical protein